MDITLVLKSVNDYKLRMEPKLNLIVATAKNMGIGLKGSIPWRLKKDLALFAELTKSTTDQTRKNAVIMGRKTWESIPLKFRPLPGRVNVVLSRSTLPSPNESVLFCSSLDEAVGKLKLEPYSDVIENVWIIGGASVYLESMERPNCHRIYVTRVQEDFECDVFMPPIDLSRFHLISLCSVFGA